MSIDPPNSEELDVLAVLWSRANDRKSTDASLTIPRINELVQRPLPPAVARIILDELINRGLVISPKRGVRDRFEITVDGLNYFEGRTEELVPPTNKLAIGEEKQAQIVKKLRELSAIVDLAELSNEEKSQAKAMMTATLAMAEAPSPPWDTIKSTLTDIGNISAAFFLAFEIIKLIA
ncbi:hypothetical protein [Qipengyuania marisflavi]|uniref:Uncharacterized protein n=1 Tax=Qipengyuania marisflavi TaxID=2486356 RepID=A0A5S3PE39_9SPHN|nr:hypothetical protein [Qipengyuania marisflavi]TMM49830.1 hypothetical protein FEV51_01110 [Qipengyuania marisflavi]